jgi:hypothetical protein
MTLYDEFNRIPQKEKEAREKEEEEEKRFRESLDHHSKLVKKRDEKKRKNMVDKSKQLKKDKLFDNFAGDEFEAKDGFNGIVRKPTRILVGESGAEYVSITPLPSNKLTHQKKIKTNNIDFHFGMDNVTGISKKRKPSQDIFSLDFGMDNPRKRKKTKNAFDFNSF